MEDGDILYSDISEDRSLLSKLQNPVWYEKAISSAFLHEYLFWCHMNVMIIFMFHHFHAIQMQPRGEL